MGILSRLFGNNSSRVEEAINSAYIKKGFNKTDVSWSDAVYFAKSNSADFDDGDEDISFYSDLAQEEVWIRIIKNPKNSKTVIIVSSAEEHRQRIKDMESGEFDPSKYPSYRLEF
ncbi:hypothetical protein [Marinomonas communis]|uniref:hypothetical protein n=1 Tax=Marinomonas communis TaxID=28254 RepID=UPI001D18694A|nr:hypothetical protein [Marinomonas communis]MCC4275992.1 hypothetical protein [Marinomonas communis]